MLFEDKKVGLFDLLNNLKGGLSALGNISIPWKNDFQQKINSLEMIYESIEDRSAARWRGNIEEDLNETILSLKKMVSIVLEEYLKISDSKITEIAIKANSKWLICPNCNDAWESTSSEAMVVCPNCDRVCHNPRSKQVD